MEITEKILNEIINHAIEDGFNITFPSIVEKPNGNKQEYEGNTEIFQYIYVEQYTGYCEDDYYGFIYYPINNQYLKVGYSC